MFNEKMRWAKLQLLGGIGNTHPMQVSAINAGWPPKELRQQLAGSIVLEDAKK